MRLRIYFYLPIKRSKTLDAVVFYYINPFLGLRPLEGMFTLFNFKAILMNKLKILQITKVLKNNSFVKKCFSI